MRLPLCSALAATFSVSRLRNLPKLGIGCALALGLAAVAPPAIEAQPFGGWNLYDPLPGGYIEIPHAPELNPTGGLTVEGWVNLINDGTCDSLIGKNYEAAWWLGSCDGRLRSYIRGGSSRRDGGEIPPGWNHIAVSWDGAHRRHYINGELAGEWSETAPLTTSTSPVQIGHDTGWVAEPNGSMNRFRLWSVGRTQAQIRQSINVPFDSPVAGLVAVWGPNGNAIVGPHEGSVVGDLPALTFPISSGCRQEASGPFLCLHGRFQVGVEWRSGSDFGVATIAPLTTDQSGIFWFFNPTNWEVMVKVLNGCSLNSRWWMFSAATTNVAYRLTIVDLTGARQKIYFNYPGPPAPAVTDTSAFNICD